jgi:hypothetical protein
MGLATRRTNCNQGARHAQHPGPDRKARHRTGTGLPDVAARMLAGFAGSRFTSSPRLAANPAPPRAVAGGASSVGSGSPGAELLLPDGARFGPFLFGPVDATGELHLAVPIGELGLGPDDALLLHEQALVTGVSGPATLSSPTLHLIVDGSL